MLHFVGSSSIIFWILHSARKSTMKKPAATPAILAIMDTVQSIISRHRAYSKCIGIYSVGLSTAFFKFPTIYSAFIRHYNLNDQYDLFGKKLMFKAGYDTEKGYTDIITVFFWGR